MLDDYHSCFGIISFLFQLEVPLLRLLDLCPPLMCLANPTRNPLLLLGQASNPSPQQLQISFLAGSLCLGVMSTGTGARVTGQAHVFVACIPLRRLGVLGVLIDNDAVRDC